MTIREESNVELCKDMACVIVHETCYSIASLLNNDIKQKHAKNLYVCRLDKTGIIDMALESFGMEFC